MLFRALAQPIRISLVKVHPAQDLPRPCAFRSSGSLRARLPSPSSKAPAYLDGGHSGMISRLGSVARAPLDPPRYSRLVGCLVGLSRYGVKGCNPSDCA